MQEEIVQKVKANPAYKELVKKRNSLAMRLAILVLVVYYTYILTIAFKPELLGAKISPNMMTTWGIPIGFAIIIFSILVTGYYTKRANSEFDDLSNQIKADIAKELNNE